MTGISATRAQRRALARQNAKLPEVLQPVPFADWPPAVAKSGILVRVWRSREFLVQEFMTSQPAVARLSICRTTLKSERWEDGISWDELQALKRQCGYGSQEAVEIFPPDNDVVNVANMRHLWVLADRLPFSWKRGQQV